MISIPERLEPIVSFATQVIVGMCLFALVFGGAILISLGMKSVESVTPSWVHAGGDFAEKVVFGCDLIGFLMFTVVETVKLARSLWEDMEL